MNKKKKSTEKFFKRLIKNNKFPEPIPFWNSEYCISNKATLVDTKVCSMNADEYRMAIYNIFEEMSKQLTDKFNNNITIYRICGEALNEIMKVIDRYENQTDVIKIIYKWINEQVIKNITNSKILDIVQELECRINKKER